jgi:hypothetical protein
MCPSATVVTNFFATERLSLERSLPIRRLRWLEPGDSFAAGDRRMRLELPPIFDGPTTRGLFDESTGVLWGVDAFAALTTGFVHHRDDVPDDLYGESFALLNRLISPWHQWLDPERYPSSTCQKTKYSNRRDTPRSWPTGNHRWSATRARLMAPHHPQLNADLHRIT